MLLEYKSLDECSMEARLCNGERHTKFFRFRLVYFSFVYFPFNFLSLNSTEN